MITEIVQETKQIILPFHMQCFFFEVMKYGQTFHFRIVWFDEAGVRHELLPGVSNIKWSVFSVC
jgi:hypothetical protein